MSRSERRSQRKSTPHTIICDTRSNQTQHNFLSHDGITNFQELVDAQQNVYNVGYDLAVLLAVLGIQAGGDVLSGRLSIGCDATSRTATLPLLGRQPGLNGHNKFEADSSLTRNDFFTANGDNYNFNGTLFAKMKEVADRVSGGNFDRNALAAYRSQRYDESVQSNGKSLWPSRTIHRQLTISRQLFFWVCIILCGLHMRHILTLSTNI
jgi:hypothetical protein